MIADLKPYSAMSDSGVPWLGKVPEDWDVRRLRNTAEMRVSNVDKHTRDDEQPVRLCNYVDVYKNDRIRSGMAFMRSTASTDEIERFRLLLGDVLITKDSESWSDIGVPALVEATADDMICGYHLALLRPYVERVHGSFLFRALQSTPIAYQFHVEANGVTRYGLSHSAIKSVWLPVPSLPEQAAIVRFLDYADRRIRRYIRAKQKLIKLLKEQKQVIINRAVTHGLDPNVRLKPSGVEWLGEVPEHWEVRRNGRLFAQRNETGHAGLPILEVSLKTGVRVRDLADGNRKQVMSDHDKYKKAAAGDIAYNMMRMWQGAVGIAPIDGLVSPAYIVARPLGGINVDYYESLFRTATYMREVNNCSRGIVQDRNRLYWEDFKQISSPFPPLAEQKQIADAIAERSRGINGTIADMNSTISFLREYRTRLIADVVTGKLDVRAAAANLPDEADELDSPDDTDALAEGDEPAEGDPDAAPEEAEA